MIFALPVDLLLQTLSFVPTKEAVATSILSKRWRCVIDSPALTDVDFGKFVEVYCLIKNMPCLNVAFIGSINPDDKFLRSLSSVIHLRLSFTKSTVAKPGGLPLSWNQPSTIPECLSSHLEIFGWRDYGGREDEKQLVRYILADSKCLKTVEISLISTCNIVESQKELESMPRFSTSSQLLCSTQMKWRFDGMNLSY